MEIQPGVGTAVEYTNNVELVPKDKSGETIAVAYVGAKITETDGPLNYGAQASLNRYKYLQDTFESSRYFNLVANADLEVVKNRFNLIMSDVFTQRAVAVLGSNTPDNIQNSNVFTFSGDLLFPISRRSSFSLVPSYSQFYFELQNTNNRQYSLSGNWNYKMTRLTDMGLSMSARNIDYTETNVLGQSIEDTRFLTLSAVHSGQTARSDYSVTLGLTNVKREGGDETTGFSGSVNWATDLSSHSSFSTGASSDLTDTSTVSFGTGTGPASNTVQVTADLIRNSVFNMVYQREDAAIRSSIRAEYRKVRYSENPLDQVGKIVRVAVDYPLTRLLTGGAYGDYNYLKRLENGRADELYSVGGNLSYNFSPKLHGSFDLKYREKQSTFDPQNYDEFSVYVSLVYGFGEVYRPTRVTVGF